MGIFKEKLLGFLEMVSADMWTERERHWERAIDQP